MYGITDSAAVSNSGCLGLLASKMKCLEYPLVCNVEKSALADHAISHGMRPQFSGLIITGSKGRFSKPGR